MRKAYYLLFLAFFTLTLNAQDRGYIITKDKYIQGYIYLKNESGNMQSCVFKKAKNTKVKEYLANEIKEFGLLNGEEVYKSHQIDFNGNTKIVFIKRILLNGGKYYYYKEKGFKEYFIEQAKTIIRIDQSEYEQAFKENSKKRNSALLKSINVGIGIDLNIGNLKDLSHVRSALSSTSLTNTGLGASILLSVPTGEKFELKSGLGYSKHSYSISGFSDPCILTTEFSSLTIPFILGYNKQSKNTSILLSLGGFYNYRSFKENSLIYNTSLITEELLKKNTIGINFGLGVRIKKIILEYQQNRSAESELKYAEHVFRLGYFIF